MIISIDGRVFQEREPTGVTRYSIFFIEELGRRYPEAAFVIFLAGIKRFAPPEFSYDLARRITWVRWRIPHLVFNIVSLIFRYPKLDRWLAKKIGREINLLVLPNLHFVSISFSAKLLVVVHDLSFLHEPRWFSWKSRIWHFLVMQQGLWSRANLLACVSEITAYDLWKTMGVSRDKISVVPYVIATASDKRGGKQSQSEIATPRQTSRLAMTQAYALAIGRIGNRKNIIGLLEGAGKWLQTRGCHLMIVGPNDKKFKNSVVTTFTGYINEADKQKFLREANLLFEVSFFEGIGLPLLEAGLMPQVVSHTTSLPEYASAQAILLNPYDLAEYPQAGEASLGKKE